MNATVIMISQGAMVFGGVIWGSIAATTGVSYALLAAAVPLLISLVLAARLSINFTRALNFDPAPIRNFSQKPVYTRRPIMVPFQSPWSLRSTARDGANS